MKVKANYYQQFDADYSREVPAEAFGGWQKDTLELAPERTALVVMHAWDSGSPLQYPGWHACAEFLSRANAICQQVFPPLLQAVRASPMKVFHVVGGGPESYKEACPGFAHAKQITQQPPGPPVQIESDPVLEKLRQFKTDHAYVGKHNLADVKAGFARLDFPPQARPLAHEGVAQHAPHLLALCQEAGVNHLIYTGFAINWCLLMSPGGMVDMGRHGLMCSTIRQAVTAMENRETARHELAKEIALWRVSLGFGFVFDLPDFLEGLASIDSRA